jgi:hypothetical protein
MRSKDPIMMASESFWVDLDPEIHCDECQEIVHFHMDKCPVCNKENAGTDQYCSPSDCVQHGGIFKCVHCDSEFKILQYEYAADTEKDALIELCSVGTEKRCDRE